KRNERSLVTAVLRVLVNTGDPFSVGRDRGTESRSGTQLLRLAAVDRDLPERWLFTGQRRVNDPTPVGRQTGIVIIIVARQLLQVGAINIHSPDVAAPGALRDEDDMAAVWRHDRDKV